jgi:MFS family permease
MVQSSRYYFSNHRSSNVADSKTNLAVGYDPSEVGYRAGLIEALFTFAQFCTSMFIAISYCLWAFPYTDLHIRSLAVGPTFGSHREKASSGGFICYLTVKLGLISCLFYLAHRPCRLQYIGFRLWLVTKLFSHGNFESSVSVRGWLSYSGTTQSSCMFRVHRAGALNGNVGVIKSSLGELSDHTNEARVFSLLPPSWTIGAALGPILGGFLADPATQYPKYFGNSAFFLKYRYALPCFVSSIFPLIGIVVVALFLKEVSPFILALQRKSNSLSLRHTFRACLMRSAKVMRPKTEAKRKKRRSFPACALFSPSESV